MNDFEKTAVDEVTGTIVEAGDIPVADGDGLHTYRRAIVIQFDNDDDIRSALAGVARIRGEWNVTAGDSNPLSICPQCEDRSLAPDGCCLSDECGHEDESVTEPRESAGGTRNG